MRMARSKHVLKDTLPSPLTRLRRLRTVRGHMRDLTTCSEVSAFDRDDSEATRIGEIRYLLEPMIQRKKTAERAVRKY